MLEINFGGHICWINNVFDWFPVTYTVLHFSQVSVSIFLQIGNIDVEQFIKFITAIIFVVKSHLDSIFTVFLPIRLNSAFVIVCLAWLPWLHCI